LAELIANIISPACVFNASAYTDRYVHLSNIGERRVAYVLIKSSLSWSGSPVTFRVLPFVLTTPVCRKDETSERILAADEARISWCEIQVRS